MCRFASCVLIEEISPAEAVGAIHTVTRVPCCHCTDACAALCLRSRAPPTSDSETATVNTAAIVIMRLRQRLLRVSLMA